MLVDRASLVMGADALPVYYPSVVPPTPRLWTIPLPPVDPLYDCFDVGDGGNSDDNFPGGGHNSHQPIQRWTDALTQDDEAPTSLAPAKPNKSENKDQSGVSSVFTPLEFML